MMGIKSRIVALLAICFFSLNAWSKKTDENSYLDEIESLQSLTDEAAYNPSVRRDARIEFDSTTTKKKLLNWVNSKGVDVLSLEGRVKVNEEIYSIFFNDLAGYENSFEEVLNTQIQEYYIGSINDEINDIAKQLELSRTESEKIKFNQKISTLESLKSQSIKWTSANIIADQSTLYDIAVSNSFSKSLKIDKINDAILFDEIMSRQDIHKRSIDDIKYRSKKDKSNKGILRPEVSQDLLSHTTDWIKKFSREISSGNYNFLIPKAYAAGSLCGNKPGETYCPPDANFKPDNPSWYVYIYQPTEDDELLYGVSYTNIDWDGAELNAFKSSTLSHCNPVLTGTSANCRTSYGALQEDVIYVPDSTYEAETVIPNPSCFGRTGYSSIDYYLGCFTPYYALSNFPSAYLDTNIFDDDDKFSATIGTYNGSLLSTSSNYSNYVYFYTSGEKLVTLTGQITRTYGQIGTRIPSSCYSNLCVFGVDTTAAINSAPLLPVIF